MKYQIPSQLQEKIPVHSESDANAIRDCLAVFQEIANLNAASDNEQGRSFSVNFLHKSNAGFKRKTKSELNVTLDRLKALGVISESALTATTSGKTKEIRYLAPAWLNGTFDELEAKLFNLLTTAPAAVTPVLESAEVTPLATEVTPLAANGGDTQIIEIALAAYDWLADPENTEIDNQNAQVFSIKRISKEIENAGEGLEILHRHWVIGVQYREPNARNRTMAALNQQWFKVGGRERLVNLLMPPKPKTYEKVGPLRVLNTFFFLHQGRSQTFQGGRVIADEQLCRLLLDGDYPVTALDDSDTTICVSCRQRFKLSDSATLDHEALLVLQDFFFTFNKITISYKRGDIISRRDFFEFLTKGDGQWPVIPAAKSEYVICPNPRCGHASKTTALQAENR